ncbi:hypothetical protein P154DRAFT_577634 [Amniculicola lignicola CBS 123094]|uniref:Rhodopsin domain-containing protein n=1 Tax=Amniculicola lignicola CBS 123094 TaxID=1392246 RepID=A0A6A5WA40_9PLEO|nr:hypothetical protein P154DRAFT_577634 [Amniculicola lignicola CBS 123094]
MSNFTPAPVYPMGLTETVLLASIWSVVGLAFCFLPVRLYTRWRTRKRLFWDDFFVVVAWLFVVPCAISATIFREPLVDLSPGNIFKNVVVHSRVLTMTYILWYTSLFCIKIAFLLFFRRLGTEKIRRLNIQWWIIFTTTISSYFISIAIIPYQCSGGEIKKLDCRRGGMRNILSISMSCVLDIVTDILIMIIPFTILSQVRLSSKQRWILSAIFSLTMLTIMASVVRTALVLGPQKNSAQFAWNMLWGAVECSVAIIVACVGSFRALFIKAPESAQPPVRSNSRSKERQLARRQQQQQVTWSESDLHYLAPWPTDSARPSYEMDSALSANMQLPANTYHPSARSMSPNTAATESWISGH